MNVQSKPSYTVVIMMAGDYHSAIHKIREVTKELKTCVNVRNIDIVYPYGKEEGIQVTLIDTPKYEDSFPANVDRKAMNLAHALMLHLHQKSAIVVTPTDTHYLSLEHETGKASSDGVPSDPGIGESGTQYGESD